MYFIASAALAPSEAAKKFFDEHMAFLKNGFESGEIALFGPYAAGGGGLFIVKAEGEAEFESILARDPLVREGLVKYEITAFNAVKANIQI